MNRDELEITAALTRVNDRISRYILRVLDEASGSYHADKPTPIEGVEHDLGTQMIQLGRKLQDRAAERGFIEGDQAPGRPPSKSQIPES